MRVPGACAWIGVALASLGCARPAPSRVELCPPRAERPARPEPGCFADRESLRYAARLGGLIGETLSGWRSHPGTAELSAIFAGDGRLDSFCFDSVSGDVVTRRVPEIPLRAQALPPAPSCFAGRRLDFAWESAVATSEEVRQVVRACRREIGPYRRQIDWCRFGQHCSLEELLDLRSEADRELRSCVLGQVPLAMRTGVTREVLRFLPITGEKPDPELAVRAHHVCEGLPRRSDVVACMGRHGWQPSP